MPHKLRMPLRPRKTVKQPVVKKTKKPPPLPRKKPRSSAKPSAVDWGLYNTLRAVIRGATLAQPRPAKGLDAAALNKERCYAIGFEHDLRWPDSVPFDVWYGGYGFRCIRFDLGTVAVCVNSPDGKSTDQVLMVEASAGPQWPETRPPQPAK